MKPRFTPVVLALTVGISPAAAERDLVPSLVSEPEICVDRPAEPEWMRDIGVREAYKRVLVQDIYRAQSMERIVALRACACDIRFPPWGASEAEFWERFVSAKRWEMLEASDAYNRRANALRPEAIAICEAEGNW